MWDDSMKDTPRLRYTAKKSYGVDELLMSSSRTTQYRSVHTRTSSPSRSWDYASSH